MNWSASMVLRSENPPGRSAQAKQHQSLKGLASNQVFGEDRRCQLNDLPPLAGDTGPPTRRVFVFLGLGCSNQARITGPCARQETLESDSRQRGAEAPYRIMSASVSR